MCVLCCLYIELTILILFNKQNEQIVCFSFIFHFFSHFFINILLCVCWHTFILSTTNTLWKAFLAISLLLSSFFRFKFLSHFFLHQIK